MASVTITLRQPIEIHKIAVDRLTLREPTGREFVELGEPRVAVHLSNGGGYFVEQPKTIKDYLERCLDHEAGVAVLALVCLEDAVRLKRALFDFFREASDAATSRP